MAECNRNCERCRSLNYKTDNNGYPWSYECMKYNDTVDRHKFTETKVFNEGE